MSVGRTVLCRQPRVHGDFQFGFRPSSGSLFWRDRKKPQAQSMSIRPITTTDCLSFLPPTRRWLPIDSLNPFSVFNIRILVTARSRRRLRPRITLQLDSHSKAVPREISFRFRFAPAISPVNLYCHYQSHSSDSLSL